MMVNKVWLFNHYLIDPARYSYPLDIGERVYSTLERALHEGCKQSTKPFAELVTLDWETEDGTRHEARYGDYLFRVAELEIED